MADPAVWTTETEIALFEAMYRQKPVGPHKHTRMVAIMAQLEKKLGHGCPSVAQVWQHIGELYDLDKLEELHNARKPDNSASDFDLEESEELGGMLESKKRH